MNRLVCFFATIVIAIPAAFAKAEAHRFDVNFTTSLPDGNVPVSPYFDFAQMIQSAGISGILDPNSISVVDKTTWQSIPFARTEDFSYGDAGHLEWVIKNPTHTQYAVVFQTTDTRPALVPQDYTPLVGVGDLLRYNAGVPRPIGMNYPSGLVDLTGDGKLDYVGTWNYYYEPGWPTDGVICYPGVGDNDTFEFGDLTRIRYVDYAGSTNYKYLSNIYMCADFADINADGLTDMIYCPTYSSTLSFYLNSGERDAGGMPVFVASGSVYTGSNDFEALRTVDLNNDGALDFVINNQWFKNTNPSSWPFYLNTAKSLNIGGTYSCFYDVDGDGWLDAVSLEDLPNEPGLSNHRVIWQKNLKTAIPSFGAVTQLTDFNVDYPTRLAAVNEGTQRGILVTHNHFQDSTFFEQTNQPGDQPVFSNFGKAKSVSAVATLSDQSWPSACDWDGDGDQDLLVGGGYGLPRILINSGTSQKMQLSEAQYILSQGEPIRITRNEVFGTNNWHDMGYPYPVYTDWDADGLPDLMLPNETNRIFWYKNIGTRANPEFSERLQVICDGYPDSPALLALSASRADNPSYPNAPYPYEAEQPFFWRTGAAFADWNGDGLMDFITHDGYTRTATLFTQYEGTDGQLHLQKDYAIQLSDGRYVNDSLFGRTSHWTERFDSVDWDGDGLMDILYSLSSGQNPTIVLLKNVGTATSPVFALPQTMSAYGTPINVTSHGPNACAGDFDGDGKADILSCTEWSTYSFFGHNAIEMSQHPNYTVSALLELGPSTSHSYSMDWNSDPGANLGGWTDASNNQQHSSDMQWIPNGGPDNSGHLMAHRQWSYLPYMVTGLNPVQAETCGNLRSLYGVEIRISLDAMIETGYPPDETGYGWWIYDDIGAIWYKNLEDPGNAPDDWTHYEEMISTTWTDAEAAANGWYSFNSSCSWQELMQNVKQWNFMGRALNYYGGSDYTGHLDNFLMESTSVFTPKPGDANCDGKVDSTDAMTLAANWLREGSNVYWQDGDFNADGIVNDKDAALLASNWESESNAIADVSEPSSWILLLSIFVFVITRKSNRGTG